MTNKFLAHDHIKSISGLRDAIRDPRLGLPDAIFDFALEITPMINVDLLIEEDAKVLLAWREDRWGVGWHVVGGIIRIYESTANRIQRTALGELGASVDFEPAPVAITQFFASRGHFISLLFKCRIRGRLTKLWTVDDGPPSVGALAWFSEPPETVYPAHVDYIARLPPFANHNVLGLAEPPVDLR